MKLFVDTNWLVAAYFIKRDENRSAIVRKFAARWDFPWHVPAPALLECRNTFASLSSETEGAEWKALQKDVGSKLLLFEMGWASIANAADQLVSRFSCKGRIGTLDLMILASALKGEATHLLSFDTNSNLRAVAAILKLKVYPELSAEDKRRMRLFR